MLEVKQFEANLKIKQGKHLNELIIELKDIQPLEFFGTQNETLTLLKTYYPQIKIVARGNIIKVFGEEEILQEFDKRMQMVLEYYYKHNTLDASMLERILTSEEKSDYDSEKTDKDFILHGVRGKKIKARTANQRRLVEEIHKKDMVFAIYPAGTGKTYTGVALAVKALKEKEVKRIILTRPAVEAGENLGFLPGDLKEKLDPYMQPLYDALFDMIPGERLDSYIERGIIQIAPMAFMRGRTLDDAFVILDEAQNTTIAQMKMFLTRMGTNAKFMITGDPGQIDLPRKMTSGLKNALHILKDVKGISMVYLDESDVIRHPLVKKVIAAYKKEEEER